MIRFRVLLLSSLVAVLGCGGESRPSKTPEQLQAQRQADDQHYRDASKQLIQRLVDRTKAKYDDYNAGKTKEPPIVDILIISGGGDWGAFGAGFLNGWGKVTGPLARPEFDAVTGVSTGALIAPFAFLGDQKSLDTIEQLYRNPQKDWVEQRGPLYFWPSNESFATVPGLEKQLRQTVTPQMLQQIADQRKLNRSLVVNTTNVDDGDMWVWDVTDEAARAASSGDQERIMQILLASAGIPAAFPFRMIDGVMYVDGGVTGNIIYGGRVTEENSFAAVWQKTYPNLAIPKIRYWIIFNNQIEPAPQVTEPRWPAVFARSMVMSTRAATVTSMRHLFAQAEISRLKRNADIEIRIAAVPNGWNPPNNQTFDKTVMNTLSDMGEKMGADPSNWITESP